MANGLHETLSKTSNLSRCHGTTLTTASTLVSSVQLQTKSWFVMDVLELQWRQKSLQAVNEQWGRKGGSTQGVCPEPLPTQEHPRKGLRVLNKPAPGVLREDRECQLLGCCYSLGMFLLISLVINQRVLLANKMFLGYKSSSIIKAAEEKR